LSVSQRKVVTNLLEGKNIFLTGRAGSGKSRTLQAVIAAMEAMGTYVAVTAASGIAAAPLKGVTLDSYMCSNEDHTLEENIRRAKMNRPELATLQVLIVDEISMVSAEKMNRVMDICRAMRRPETPYPQFLLVGDFKQLPPVKGKLLLGSDTWQRLQLEVVMLTDGFRQTNQPAFLEMLDEAGMGALSDRSRKLLESRVGVKFGDTQDIRPTILLRPHLKVLHRFLIDGRASVDAVDILLRRQQHRT
jgi:energy-coupling factor transporter ATP-binding protein EcfA2